MGRQEGRSFFSVTVRVPDVKTARFARLPHRHSPTLNDDAEPASSSLATD